MIRRFPHGKGLVADDALALSTRSLLCFSHFSSGNEYASLCTSHKVMKENKKRKWRIKRKRNKGKKQRGEGTRITTPPRPRVNHCSHAHPFRPERWSIGHCRHRRCLQSLDAPVSFVSHLPLLLLPGTSEPAPHLPPKCPSPLEFSLSLLHHDAHHVMTNSLAWHPQIASGSGRR